MNHPIDKPTTAFNDNEVDAQHFANRIGGFYNQSIYGLYRLFRFLKRKWYIVLGIVIIGGILGYLNDKRNEDRHLHEVIVVPNFSSVDYLYNRIESFNISEFNKDLEAKNINDKLYSVKIEPIYDAYNFIINDPTHLKAFQILSERAIDLEKYSKSKLASKNYKFHLLKIYTKGGEKNDVIVDKVLNTFNEDEYFNKRKEIEKTNTINKRTELAKSVEQINGMFNRLGAEQKVNDLSLNTYNQIGDVLQIKEDLIRQINATDVQLIEQDKVIYDATRVMNIKVKSLLPSVLLFPILLVFVYVVVSYLRSKINRLKKEI